MGHFFSKVSLFIDKKEAAAHLILDQDFATASIYFLMAGQQILQLNLRFASIYRIYFCFSLRRC